METPSGDKGRLGGKFEGFSHTPKDDVWARIAAGQGSAKGPGRFGSRFAGFSHPPHARVWRRISHTLQPQRRRLILLSWSVAASLTLLLGWGFYQWQLAPTETQPGTAKAFAARRVVAPVLRDQVIDCNEAGTLNNTTFHNNGAPVDANDLRRNNQPAPRPQPAPSRQPGAWVNHDQRQPTWSPLPTPTPQPEQHLAPTFDQKIPDSSAIAQVQPVTKKDSFITEVFPEIDLPKGDEPENALAFSLGSSLFPGNNGVMSKGFNAFERDNFSLSDPQTGLGTAVNHSAGFSANANETFETPLSFGFFADLPLSRRWSVGLGTTYTLMRSDFIDRSKATRQYLGLGTRATFAFLQGKRTRLYALAGLQMDFGISQTFAPSENNTVSATSDFKAGNHLSAQAGLGTDFALSNRFALYGQLAASSYLVQSHSNLWSQRLLWPTAQVGLRMKL